MVTTALKLVVQRGVESFALVVNGDEAGSEQADYGSISIYEDPATHIRYGAICDGPDEDPDVFRMEPLTVSETEDIRFPDEPDELEPGDLEPEDLEEEEDEDDDNDGVPV